MEPPPRPVEFELLLALMPALAGAAYATITATMNSLTPARRIALKESLSGGSRRALERYLSDPDRIEARWLWIRVGGVALTAALLTEKLEGGSFPRWVLGLAGATLVYAIPSEFARPFAAAHAESLVAPLLKWLRPIEWLVAPLSDPLSYFAHRLAGESRPQPSASLAETEVEMIVNEGEQNGSFSRDQSEMIRNVLDFRDLRAKDVMIPRVQVDLMSENASFEEVYRIIADSQHSRYPVFSGTSDNIVGILHVKDLLARKSSPAGGTTVRELSRKPVVFVPEGQAASMVLADMRHGRHHLAVVIDEFGGFSGIITLEDLLEEIVGDIRDEHDGDEAERILHLGPGRALLDASLSIEDVNQALGTELPEGDYLSLGGLLLDQIGRVPASGSRHELFGLEVIIHEADRRRIIRVELEGFDAGGRSPEEPDSSATAA